MDTDTPCPCQRKKCHEDWHRNPTSVLMEEVTLTIPRHALERAAYLVDLMDGAWSTNYRVMTPYLLDPKPDPSTPIDELSDEYGHLYRDYKLVRDEPAAQ